MLTHQQLLISTSQLCHETEVWPQTADETHGFTTSTTLPLSARLSTKSSVNITWRGFYMVNIHEINRRKQCSFCICGGKFITAIKRYIAMIEMSYLYWVCATCKQTRSPWVRQSGQQQVHEDTDKSEDVGCDEIHQRTLGHVTRGSQVYYWCQCTQSATHGLTWRQKTHA